MSDFKMEWLHQYLKKSPEVIFDVGAFNGEDALGFKNHFPQAAVYAFEADPRNYTRCQQVGTRGVHLSQKAMPLITSELRKQVKEKWMEEL